MDNNILPIEPITNPAPIVMTPVPPALISATNPPSAFESGGNVSEGDWFKSVKLLETTLVFLGFLTLYAIIHYHRLKIINLKTEIPTVKKQLADVERQVSFLAESKMDKKQTQSNKFTGFPGN